MRRPLLHAVALALLGAAPSPAAIDGEPASPIDISSPLAEIKAQIERGHFAEAEKGSRDLRTRVIAAGGEGTLAEARVLDGLVEALWRSGRGSDPEALELARKAVTIKEQRLGIEDTEVAVSLRHLGRVRQIRNETPEAIALYERAIGVFIKRLGPEAPEVGMTQNFLGNLYLEKWQPSSAKPLFESALSIYQKVGPEQRVASILHNLGLLNHQMGNFHTSRDFYEKALAIKTRLYGAEHIEVAWTLNGLANLTEEIGDFIQARSLYERVLSIREKALGPQHIHVAWGHNNLGQLLEWMGEYAGAESHLETALFIERATVGEQSPHTATTLLNMAHLKGTTGDYQRARDLYEETLRIREKILSPDDPALANTIYELASLQAERGELSEAETLFRRALAIWRGVLSSDPSSPLISTKQRDYARSLNGLAGLLLEKRNLAEARALYEQALDIRERAFRADHPIAAESLEGLATVLTESGDLEASLSARRRVLRIREASLGATHPLTGKAHRDLGALLARMGDVPGALEASLAAERIGRDQLRLTSRFLSDRQALLYASIRPSGLDVALSLAAKDLDSPSRRRVWETLIRSRAIVLDEMAARRRALVKSAEDTEVAALLGQLSAAGRRLANIHVKGPDPQDPDRYYRLFDEALREKEGIEKTLASKSAEFRKRRAEQEADLGQLLANLPQGGALVAYARYQDQRGTMTSPSYLAFLGRATDTDLRVIPLGSADSVDRLIARWTSSVTHGGGPARASRAGVEDASRESGEALRRAIWDPIASQLGSASRVFLVPDGMINLVSFSALPIDGAAYMVERGPTVHYLSAERELLPAAAPSVDGQGLLVLGGPAFDEPQRVPTPRAPAAAPGPPLAFDGAHSSCGYFKDVTFPPLPGTLKEVAEISELWRRTHPLEPSGRSSTTSLMDLTAAEASEEAFKATAPGRRIVHLATHGFYLDDLCSSAATGMRGIGGLGPAPRDPAPTPGENPLLLSGLALAGANRRDAALPDQEDGVLTAEEIGAMDLSGVDWVVLSACHSGVGEIRTGEGVIGLRRSFQLAGARTLIMSLWPVDDEATRQWMVRLYQERLEGGLDTAEAVRRASQWTLKQLRETRRPTNPFYWGGFVASGNWR